MASVVSELIEEDTAHAQSDSLEDTREICADGTYFPNNLRKLLYHIVLQRNGVAPIKSVFCMGSHTEYTH